MDGTTRSCPIYMLSITRLRWPLWITFCFTGIFALQQKLVALSLHMASLDLDAQSEEDTLPLTPPPSPANGVGGPIYWCYHDLFPNIHQLNTKYKLQLQKDNCPLKTDGSTLNKDEQKKYELVLVETALLVFREHRNPKGLLGVLDGFPEGSLELGKIILNAVSNACNIALKEVQMVLNLRVSVF